MSKKDIYLLDSNVVIGLSVGEDKITNFINKNLSADFYVSVLTITEVLWYKNISKEEFNLLEDFINNIKVIEVNRGLAEKALKYRRDYNLKTVDSLIVASAESVGAKLVTRDKKLLVALKALTINV